MIYAFKVVNDTIFMLISFRSAPRTGLGHALRLEPPPSQKEGKLVE